MAQQRKKNTPRGKITKKQKAIIIDKMFHEESPFARLFEREIKKK